MACSYQTLMTMHRMKHLFAIIFVTVQVVNSASHSTLLILDNDL